MCRTANVRASNGGKARLALDSIPFSKHQMRLGNGRVVEPSLAASSCRNKNGTLSGKKTPTSCMSFGSWKAQNVKKMLILDKHKQHDTLHYSIL